VTDCVEARKCYEKQVGNKGEEVVELEPAIVPNSEESPQSDEGGCDADEDPDNSLRSITLEQMFIYLL
jgi:hypothetical protein